MSYRTLLYVWDAFTFILFFVVLLSSIQNEKGFKNNRKLIMVSFFLFIGMFLFYREQYTLYQGNSSQILTFFTYSFTSLAHFLIASMIVTLYTKKELTKEYHIAIVTYSIVVGIVMTLNLTLGSFLSTHIFIGIINAIPLTHLLIYLILYDHKFYKNVFVFQILLLLIVYISKTVNLILNYDTISFTTGNYHDIGMLMVANVIIFSFLVSYLLMKNAFINEELVLHRNMIEASLSSAIQLSEKDALTEVYNRRKIYSVIDSYYKLKTKSNQVFSIVLIDVDKFKDINDIHGHNTGDEVLKFISNVLVVLLREQDYVSRWGGDEFLLLLPNTNKEKCHHVVNKINLYLEANQCPTTSSNISLSFGVAESLECEDIESLLHLADQRMYTDKNNG